MTETPGAPEQDPVVAAVAAGYAFEGPAVEIGGLMLSAEEVDGTPVRIPLGMFNRHGLVAGATGTGKTVTLQLLAEQLSAQGVPVFAADVKGDFSGLLTPGEGNEKLLRRTSAIGQDWQAQGFPVELYALGGDGVGIPLRVTMSAFGPMLLCKVLELNDTQESSLGLIFRNASRGFLDQVAQTVRLIRSKGVGVFFVTQSPTDVPDEILGQLGSRIQHQLRAHSPNDAKALRATVNTYPHSGYDDLGQVITGLGIGEAVVTVMNERGAPTPVARTRLRAPESRMGPAEPETMRATIEASPRNATYGTRIDRESAHEILAAKLEEGARKAAEDATDKEAEATAKVAAKAEKAKAPKPSGSKGTAKKAPSRTADDGLVDKVVSSPVFKDFMRTAARESARGMFRSGRR